MALSVCICDEHLELTDEGILCVRAGAFGPRLTLVYESDGQFTPASYPWLSKVYAKVQAAGGGSGGAPASGEDETSAGAGGGGGGYAEALVDVSSLASTELITVGAGGSAGVYNGGDGGFSSFGSHAFATGGAGGWVIGGAHAGDALFYDGIAQSGAGGVGTIGDIKCRGGAGGYGWAVGGQGLRKGGRGGNSRLGGGRGGRTSNGPGLAGRSGTGEGAGGAAVGSEGSRQVGGEGGSGLVTLVLYG